jgi:hypothetical protein
MFFLRTLAVPAPPQTNSEIFDYALVAPVARSDLSLLAGMAPPIMAQVGSGRWIVRPISLGTVAAIRAEGV